ncbi:MAG TPA: tetratricopeptide repeat protein [Candidatus Methylomirabilis sp.]|nr:tetratricopeptide repeat protein [Candidatus Methylomirabilis sp.]
MRTFHKAWAWAAVLAAALACTLAPRANAQGTGSIVGTILDVNAKPWYGLNVEAVSDQGAKQDTKTDQEGKYAFRNLRVGVYTVTITAFPPPNDKQPPVTVGQLRVSSGEEARADMNFKDVLAKQGAAAQEQVKKQSEEKAKFESMKEHFTAGAALLEQERKAKDDLTKATPDQRDQLKQNLKDLSDKAAAEFQAAEKAAPEHDNNQALIWGNLGQAYDLAGRNDEAAEAYKQATLAKPDDPGYFNNLGNVLARAGKIDDARAAYTKSAELDPTKAAMAWRNFGISLYNANRLGDAVEPLQKSAELDPKSAQTWYLLGASLVYKMTVKKVGDKDVPVFAPGTIEAYQKAIELDPNGPYGQQAKLGLEQLQQMAPGMDLKVNTKKKKS